MDAQAREALRRAIAHEHLLFLHAQQADAEAERWRQRTELALRRGEQDLAKQALERQQSARQRGRHYREQYEAQTIAIRAAKQGVAPASVPPPSPTVEDRLEALVREDKLERELADLKRQLLP